MQAASSRLRSGGTAPSGRRGAAAGRRATRRQRLRRPRRQGGRLPGHGTGGAVLPARPGSRLPPLTHQRTRSRRQGGQPPTNQTRTGGSALIHILPGPRRAGLHLAVTEEKTGAGRPAPGAPPVRSCQERISAPPESLVAQRLSRILSVVSHYTRCPRCRRGGAGCEAEDAGTPGMGPDISQPRDRGACRKQETRGLPQITGQFSLGLARHPAGPPRGTGGFAARASGYTRRGAKGWRVMDESAP